MNTAQIILVIIATAFALWQVTLLVAYARMVSNPRFRNVTVGIAPGTVAVVLYIVAVLVK